MTKPFIYEVREECFRTRRYKGHYIHSSVQVMSDGSRQDRIFIQNDETYEILPCKTILGAQRMITSKWGLYLNEGNKGEPK